MTFDEYFDKYIGKGIDYDGQFGVQCFTANHYVLMADKTYKAIQDIEVGDKVIGYDNKVNTVTKVFKRNADVIKVRTNIGTICVTEDHPFYFMDGTFDNITAAENKRLAFYDDLSLSDGVGLSMDELIILGKWISTPNTDKLDGCNNQKLLDVMNRCYNYKGEKVVPLIFAKQEYEHILEGLIDTYMEHNDISMIDTQCNPVTISSTSKALILSIQAIALICGCSINNISEINYDENNSSWNITLMQNTDNANGEIQILEHIDSQEVYNIETDGSHTYICDNYKVHNCFDLANDYSVKVVGGKAFIGMGAYEIYTNFNNQPGHNLYERIPNTPEFVPQKGDIMVWGTGIGQYGHVAICTGEGDTTWFNSLDQNWTYAYAPVTLVRHSYNSVLGVLRPKDQKKVLGIVKGDANGDGKIDVSDIATISSHIKGIKAIDEKIFFAADVNSDGKIDVSDIANVASHIKGIKPIK